MITTSNTLEPLCTSCVFWRSVYIGCDKYGNKQVVRECDSYKPGDDTQGSPE